MVAYFFMVSVFYQIRGCILYVSRVDFGKSGAGLNFQTLGALVRKPFHKCKHTMQTFKYHVTLSVSQTILSMKNNVHLSIENQF